MTDDLIVCANPACRVSETGKCIEGLSLPDCLQYGREPEEQEVSQTNFLETVPSAQSLPNGNTLSIDRAVSLLIEKESRVVTIIGPRNTGKTSLVAGIYDLFQNGSIGEVKFARSQTLQAFELACHDARQASRRKTPHMERTNRGEVRFYHLGLSGGAAGIGLTLLMADRSGEEYSDVANDISTAADLVEVRRADTITFLVDGARLMDVGLRHNIKSEVAMISQGLVESGALGNNKRVALVLTKFDLISESSHAQRVDNDFNDLCSQLCKVMEGRIRRLEKFKIAASPESANMIRGTGIGELLNFWLEVDQVAEVIPQCVDRPSRAMARIKPLDN